MSDTPSTSGIQLRNRRGALAETVELLSSMRFAIALFVVIIFAAIIGTIVQQSQPMPNYINQFGPFWFEVFNKLGLYAIYSSWWFVSMCGLLVVSTSLCIVHNTPKMLKDMRSWREKVREASLNNFHHKAHWQSPLSREQLAGQTAQRLGHAGYGTKVIEKDGAILVSAKRGAGNKFGYIFAHSAIVIILVGGMLDSDLPIRFQQWVLGKTAFGGTGLIADIPAQHRLGVHNPTYRGNIALPEGTAGNTAILSRPDGVLIQELPFTIQLKKFDIDFYSTGMPKLFASHVTVRSNESGKTVDAVVEVNKPLIFEGVAIYQSSFEDGGSKLKLLGHPMKGTATTTFGLDGEVNGTTKLSDEYTVEWSDFRPFNVENISGQDARAVTKGESLNESFSRSLDKQLGSAAKTANNKDLKNVGPSVQYKLRDKTGQAREYQNYMQPVTIEGDTVFLAGVRANPSDPFSYLRIPADDEHSVREWMRLRAALQDPLLRQKAAAGYAARAMPQSKAGDALRGQLEASALKGLEIFAGDTNGAGFFAISRFLEKVPQAEQTKAAEIFLKILNGSMWELWQAARAQDGKPAATMDEAHGRFLQLATNALSDSFFYGAPVYLQLDEFTQVKASVFQVTRSPGKTIVYLGCLLLVLGVFAMFYIRERRVWVWIKDGEGGAAALMAMSTQRKTLDFEQEFKELKEKLPQTA
ncbi:MULTISPECIES: cytochrome c biogenesis protein ResB [unclassified Duganella]|uniref:cytochrome c biogenesis protein ResB n=1 Tax=unclassified Duganella TaxID=2636909 RepID=UPI0006F3FBF9|nr:MULTISPECIES: cytochrome c biogenesis protein ResB [unclassified Duganella]KQV44679.1 cytochrome C biogenesis protein ResB [Duganella sp. Root336D2]KRB83201.1 cytochrome C biogenesis protein ResB [Duganella sp. Root198D2]